jgi:hypothetical protein
MRLRQLAPQYIINPREKDSKNMICYRIVDQTCCHQLEEKADIGDLFLDHEERKKPLAAAR